MSGVNTRSDYLVILVGSYNRLEQLKIALASIETQTRCSHEIIVIDGGSTDGTVEYLKAHRGVASVFQGELLGASRAYNQVWRQVESKYTCWLSDDEEIVNSALDLAVQILEENPDIGMVGLKTKDVVGPSTEIPYTGAISEYGILNCNHGVLSMDLLRSVGYFNESYPTYMIDPDLTASILCAGKKIVMTRSICILHYREWALNNFKEKLNEKLRGIDHNLIYHQKFLFLEKNRTLSSRIRKFIVFLLDRPLFRNLLLKNKYLNLNSRDWLNLAKGRFIRLIDPLINDGKQYYLMQNIPHNVLMRDGNPYKHLLDGNS